MEAGEFQLRQAFEQVTTKNVQTMIAYSTETRKLVREFEEKITHLTNLMLIQDNTIDELRKQLAIVQGKIYSGGT